MTATTTDLLPPRIAHKYLADRGIHYSPESLKKRRTTHPHSPAFTKIGGRIYYHREGLKRFIAGAV